MRKLNFHVKYLSEFVWFVDLSIDICMSFSILIFG